MTIQPVILAGGSGTRLWPASRQAHPKQLLALTGPYSFLQETALRLQGLADGPAAGGVAGSAYAGSVATGQAVADPIVVTNEDYRFMVADQLREVGVTAPRIVLEPVGRNTAPALTLAALLLGDGGYDPVLLIVPSDHLIRDVPAFLAAVAEGAEQAENGMLVTFGIVPDRPETGYGYIRVGKPAPGTATARLLAGFTEKPDVANAERYLASGDYLWNSGIFMTKRSVWLAALERDRPEILAACRAAVAGEKTDGLFVRLDKAAFTACPSDSIDYAVMEKLDAGQAVVVPLDAGWSDIGAWAALWAVCAQDESGNVARGNVILEDTRNTLVHADARLVTVLGADDLVVVETADAVLVAPKDKTDDLKKLVARVRDKAEDLTIHHRRVHRPWGLFDSIDRGERFQVKRIVVSPGASLSLQLHEHRAEHWVVVRGVAEVTCGEKTFRLGEDESTYVPVGTSHRLANPGTEPLEIIEVQSGDYLGEDDIVRLDDVYGRLDDQLP
jgi:mannose-1-phosphate guanylyltransferase / mannose-6-phosphate isomerase